jgi:hypothetical protein
MPTEAPVLYLYHSATAPTAGWWIANIVRPDGQGGRIVKVLRDGQLDASDGRILTALGSVLPGAADMILVPTTTPTRRRWVGVLEEVDA